MHERSVVFRSLGRLCRGCKIAQPIRLRRAARADRATSAAMLPRVQLVQVVANVAVEASGPSYSVPALCAGLARLGHDVRLHTVEPAPAAWPWAGVAHTTHPRSLPSIPLRASTGLHAALRREAQSAAVLHGHG